MTVSLDRLVEFVESLAGVTSSVFR
jgi:hypothetical protein